MRNPFSIYEQKRATEEKSDRIPVYHFLAIDGFRSRPDCSSRFTNFIAGGLFLVSWRGGVQCFWVNP